MNTIQCHGCLAVFVKDTEDTITEPHPYIGAVHNCWKMYSEILAREFENPEYFKIHRITVDSYAAQHIGDQTDRRARQSANLHLIALYLYYEKKTPIAIILEFLRKTTVNKHDWPAVEQLTKASWLTVHDIITATTAQEHYTIVIKWGKSVWDSYKDQHAAIVRTYEDFLKQ